MHNTIAQVQTLSGQRLINRLCKHWAHKLEVDIEQGRVVFEGGVCLMRADETSLHVELQADNTELLERLKGIVASHLERMAGKEELVINWQ